MYPVQHHGCSCACLSSSAGRSMLHKAAISVLLGFAVDAGFAVQFEAAEAFCLWDLLDGRSCSLDPSDSCSATLELCGGTLTLCGSTLATPQTQAFDCKTRLCLMICTHKQACVFVRSVQQSSAGISYRYCTHTWLSYSVLSFNLSCPEILLHSLARLRMRT